MRFSGGRGLPASPVWLRLQARAACGLVAIRARGGPVGFVLSLSSRSLSGRSSAEVNPRLALSPDEAAASIGVSRDFFDAHIAHELRVVRRGRRKLIPVRELEKWLDRAASTALDGSRSTPLAGGGRDAAARHTQLDHKRSGTYDS